MTHAEREPFIAAIRATTDDDVPRLIYADRLDDAGECDLAAFVRAQVNGNESGARGLLQRNYRQWLAPFKCSYWQGGIGCVYVNQAKELRGAVTEVKFVRGFLDSVKCRPGHWRQRGRSVLKAHPLVATLEFSPWYIGEMYHQDGDGRYEAYGNATAFPWLRGVSSSESREEVSAAVGVAALEWARGKKFPRVPPHPSLPFRIPSTIVEPGGPPW